MKRKVSRYWITLSTSELKVEDGGDARVTKGVSGCGGDRRRGLALNVDSSDSPNGADFVFTSIGQTVPLRGVTVALIGCMVTRRGDPLVPFAGKSDIGLSGTFGGCIFKTASAAFITMVSSPGPFPKSDEYDGPKWISFMA